MRNFTSVPARCVRAVSACVLTVALCCGLAACTTTGHRFNPCAVSRLTPGVSTYADAVAELGSVAAATYIQDDDSFVAHWYVRDSIVTDALYQHYGIMLVFSAEGRFVRPAHGRSAMLCGVFDQTVN